MKIPCLLVLAAVAVLSSCSSGIRSASSVAAIRSSAHDERPTGFPSRCAPGEVSVMLVGTFHFEGSATDDVSGPPLDVFTPQRQRELERVVARLAVWQPEQIAVELPLSHSDSTTARFARYVAAGGQTTSANEVEQLAFRLARRLGHSTVYPIDHAMRIGNDSIGALVSRRPDLKRLSDSLTRVLQNELAARRNGEETMTLLQRLHAENTDSSLHAGNSWSMFQYLVAGEGNNRGGPQLIARWYERNFYIAHNLTRVLRPETRRVLVLVGSGHIPPLRNILDESPKFCPLSPLTYLR